MKFTCDKIAMADAVGIVQKAVATRSTMPILEGILIKTEQGKVTVTGNDLEIGISSVLEASVDRTGSVVVNARLFGEIIRKLSGETVSIETNANNVTTIRSGNSKFNINGIDAQEYPEIPQFESLFDLKLQQKQLKELIRGTIFAVGTNDTKPILTGCLLEAFGNRVSMVAVDGFRLALRNIELEQSITDQEVSIVIPAKTLNELLRILQDNEEELQIFCSEKNIRFEFDNVMFTSRLLEGDYIDYKKIIPSDYTTELKVDVRTFTDAVDRASLIITSEVTKSPVILSVEDGKIDLFCETQAGRVEEMIPVEMSGQAQKIGFNNRFLLDALKAASSEQVTVSMIGSVNPCLIAPAEGNAFQFIVLPVRLKNEN